MSQPLFTYPHAEGTVEIYEGHAMLLKPDGSRESFHAKHDDDDFVSSSAPPKIHIEKKDPPTKTKK